MTSTGAGKKTFQFKLVLLGESSVGKSSLVQRFIKQQYQDFQESTIGAAYHTHKIELPDCVVKLEIWDTAGQERYNSLAPMYYRGAAAAIVLYDITQLASFQRAKSWIEELQRHGSQGIVIALAGNKLDLANERQIQTEEAKQLADEHGVLFFETSARTNHNVTEVFRAVATALPKAGLGGAGAGGAKGGGFVVAPEGGGEEQKEAKSGGCCS